MKPKLNKAAVSKAGALRRKGLALKDIAACLGVSEQTLSRWIHHPETRLQEQLGEELARSEAGFRESLLESILKARERDWRAAAWMLARMYPAEFAEARRPTVCDDVGQDDGQRVRESLIKAGFIRE